MSWLKVNGKELAVLLSVLVVIVVVTMVAVVHSCAAADTGYPRMTASKSPNIFDARQELRPPARPPAETAATRRQKVKHGRDYSLKFVLEKSYPADGPCERLEILGNLAAGKTRAMADCRNYFGGECKFEKDERLTGILRSKGYKGEVFRTIPPGGCIPK